MEKEVKANLHTFRKRGPGKCVICSTTWEREYLNKLYCSRACQNKRYNQKHKARLNETRKAKRHLLAALYKKYQEEQGEGA